ncbi:riboflavin synthase [soil metagenome]
MFTGLIEELGYIAEIIQREAGSRVIIEATQVTSDLSDGDSISVNGVCLTALEVTRTSFAADVSPETLARTTLGDLNTTSRVNLERAMLRTARLGGHIVQGHVDGRGEFIRAVSEGDFWTVSIGFPAGLSRYFVEKGSVTVEGISLTIASLLEKTFDIAVIPKTWEMTNLSTLIPGNAVNMEVDVIAKYVERMMNLRPPVSPAESEDMFEA